MNGCKRCLLYEAGEKKAFEGVKDYLSTLPESEKINSSEYENRLSECKSCDNLISGMCLKCGCYVEIRAALKNKNCPNENGSKW